MSLGYKLTYHKDAVKFIAKQEKRIQEQITQGLKGLLIIPPVGDIKPMKGFIGLYRLRIGTLRILFEINHDEKVVYIRAIDSHGGIYK
ncbi:type II toxin-antitoxin system RelE/ParE family toxin [Cohnella lubricantis]|uniref:Type II toxin-antitoxin system RelE/ParE family toxin n=2 Tax=Paenibacillaceae TaxID=186822 RepID=A0A841TB94_9BACL|nr:type II toxin-antitoxin system RelE/ParE family toxin [Cohnella lubricantis]MBM7588943.1 mRNA interferase RelE/StbE [Brevibacillus fulvus]MBP2898810.1 type II toxin-antitoxin system RelE/ParE family toxin [Escherichia coli]OJH16009.1 plasmid stabilization protein [Bacillus obstructivus]MBB6677366.1 type II toxin-antitoxin system RelE/ParE family toxin [Cohnella lubricantis]MBP2120587.1 mRNA interferase RelE/StbE [Cohnella lubricantis]